LLALLGIRKKGSWQCDGDELQVFAERLALESS